MKIFIPTSGIGSRLGDITKYTNKSLVKIGKKPTISYIIEKYGPSHEYVITLGYYGSHVKQFLKMAYPNYKFTFVEVSKYKGKGTSLGFSMLHARDHLQEPFIYNACDTITFDNINLDSNENWIGGYSTDDLSQYDSFNTDSNGSVTRMFEKGEIGSDYAYIGLIGIKDYELFWSRLSELYENNPNNTKLSDFWCVKSLIEDYIPFKGKVFNTWHDIGNVNALRRARNSFPDKFPILDKAKESIYIMGEDQSIIKFFSDSKLVSQRVERANLLGDAVPTIINSSENFYQYEYVSGDLLADVITPKSIIELVEWAQDKLWSPVPDMYSGDFHNLAHNFYYEKTMNRISDYLGNVNDIPTVINDELVPDVNSLIEDVDFNMFYESEPTRFHGDFILDNIIKTETGFKLLDWRQNFGGNVYVGDVYYDLAKLNHNLTVNHDIINRDLFTVDKKDGSIYLDIHRRQTLVDSQKELHKWIDDRYDLNKVKMLTSIIWLNMAPLHHKPFDQFLFYYGKYTLYNLIKNAAND